MLPTQEEQDEKLHELMYKYYNDVILHANNRKEFAKQYAKWYTEQVIKHCTEVAKANLELAVEGENSIYIANYNAIIDKQSILNIINEL